MDAIVVVAVWLGAYAIAKAGRLYVPRLAGVNFLLLYGGAFLLEVVVFSAFAVGLR